MAYARSTRAVGECDRCSRRVLLSELRPQVVNEITTGLHVCDWCLDRDQEQLQVGKMFRAEPMTVRDARPDKGLLQSRGQVGWNPTAGVIATASVGTVTGTVS